MSTLRGIRTDSRTGVAKSVELQYEVRDGWLHILNGSTGYESARLDHLLLNARSSDSGAVWSACYGTPGRWDALDVDLASILEVLGTYS